MCNQRENPSYYSSSSSQPIYKILSCLSYTAVQLFCIFFFFCTEVAFLAFTLPRKLLESNPSLGLGWQRLAPAAGGRTETFLATVAECT